MELLRSSAEPMLSLLGLLGSLMLAFPSSSVVIEGDGTSDLGAVPKDPESSDDTTAKSKSPVWGLDPCDLEFSTDLILIFVPHLRQLRPIAKK